MRHIPFTFFLSKLRKTYEGVENPYVQQLSKAVDVYAASSTDKETLLESVESMVGEYAQFHGGNFNWMKGTITFWDEFPKGSIKAQKACAFHYYLLTKREFHAVLKELHDSINIEILLEAKVSELSFEVSKPIAESANENQQFGQIIDNAAETPLLKGELGAEADEERGVQQQRYRRIILTSFLFLIGLPILLLAFGYPKDISNKVNYQMAQKLLAGGPTLTDGTDIFPTQPQSLVQTWMNDTGLWILRKLDQRTYIPAARNLGGRLKHGYYTAISISGGVKLIKKAADAGDPGAQLSMASDYASGDGVKYSRDEALKYYNLLFENPAAIGTEAFFRGKRNYAWLHLNGKLDFEINPKAARALFELANTKLGIGAEGLGVIYNNGYGVPKDFKRAETYFKAADEDDTSAKIALGQMYVDEKIEGKRIDDAIAILDEIDDRINSRVLGVILKWKELKAESSSEEDIKPKLADYEVAANYGSTYAIGRLVQIYQNGEFGAKDLTKSNYWAKKLAKTNSSGNLNWLGMHYRDLMIPNRYAIAELTFKRAACLGSTYAYNWLGVMVQNKEISPFDPARAFYFFKQGALRGDPWAKHHLGEIYSDVNSIPHDPEQGKHWLRQAALTGPPWIKRDYALSVLNSFWSDSDTEKQSEALSLIEEAASAGDGDANAYLAIRYVEENYEGETFTQQQELKLSTYIENAVSSGTTKLFSDAFDLPETFLFNDIDDYVKEMLSHIGQDYSTVTDLVEQAALEGSDKAFELIFHNLYKGSGDVRVTKNEKLLRNWLLKYLELSPLWVLFREYDDEYEAQSLQIQKIIRQSILSEKLIFDAIQILEDRAADGHRNAIKTLRFINDNSEVNFAYSGSPNWLIELEDKTEITENTFDQITIARLYRDGLGDFKTDVLAAGKWYGKAIEKENMSALLELLEMYVDGRFGEGRNRVIKYLTEHFDYPDLSVHAESLLERISKSDEKLSGKSSLIADLTKYVDKTGEDFYDNSSLEYSSENYALNCDEILSEG